VDRSARTKHVREALSASAAHGGPMDRTLTFLVMGIDHGAGSMRLEGDRLRIHWPASGAGDEHGDGRGEGNGNARGSSSNLFDERLAEAAAALGGTFLPDPMARLPFGRSMVTVHPLGGCVMADDAEHGVVDDVGRVFEGTKGTERHRGLYVLDGSIVPLPLGINPLLTIAALAERACAAVVAEGASRGPGARNRAKRAAPSTRPERGSRPERTAAPAGLVFTEAMAGPISTHGLADRHEPVGSETGPDRQRRCRAAAAAASRREGGSPMRFVLTVSFDDLNALLRDPAHPGRLSGTVTAPALARAPMIVSEGSFDLFAPDVERAGGTLMRYRMILVGGDGARFHFDGFKVLGKRSFLRTWPDTTTLYTTVRDAVGALDTPTEFAGPIHAMGVLRLDPLDFGRQLMTMRATNVGGRRARRRDRNAFTRMFAGTLLGMYGRVLDRRPRWTRDARPHGPSRPFGPPVD
jgi:cholesterol oxidase